MKTKACVLAGPVLSAAVLVATAVLLTSSCAALPKRTVQAVMFEETGAGWPGDDVPIVIETVEIVWGRNGVGGQSVAEAYPLTEMLEAAGRKEGLAIHTTGRWKRRWKRNNRNPYRLRFRIIEKKVTRDLTVLYSVAAQAVLMQPETERTILEIIYHEENTASVESSYRLYSVIKAIMRKTARIIRKAQAERIRG